MKFNEYLAFLTESKDGDFITSIVHLITNINGNEVEIFLDLADYISQDKADEILKDTLKTLNSKTTKSELESALTKAFKGSKIMKTEPDFGYTTYKKYIKESKDDFDFSNEDVKTLKSLKFKINSDNNQATMDFFSKGGLSRIIVITAAEFGAVDIKIVRNMKQADTYYETKDVDLEEAKKYIPAVIEELQAFIEAEEDFDNVWNKI